MAATTQREQVNVEPAGSSEVLWLSPEQVAVRLGIPRTSVYNLLSQKGALRSFKFGRRRLVTAESVREFARRYEAEVLGDDSSSPVV